MRLVCPRCSSNVPDTARAADETCPVCGARMVQDETDGAAAATSLPSDLEADLRDAFSTGVYSLGMRAASTRPDDVSTVPGGGVPLLRTVSAGARLGDFEILGEIGRGGMGIVYRARQVSLNRTVALKVLSAFADPGSTAVDRFRKEAQAAARLHHTNIVAIHAQGEYEGHYYYAMELIEGDSLDVALRRGAFGKATDAERHDDDAPVRRTGDDYRRIARLVAEVADALDYAHQHGVVHRDIKPQNLLLGRDGRLHITDFGLARLLHEPHLTMTGEIMGTPAYMSPEQVRLGHGQMDWRTDIYSLGVTLYEALSLQRPFQGETRDQIIDQVCAQEPRPPRRIDPRIPVDLDTICLRAMEKNRLRRYPAAADLAEDLRRFADGRPILSRRTSRVAIALKWMRRKKALTAVIASSVAIAALIVGLTVTQLAWRSEQALQLCEKAYEHLAYVSFRDPEQDLADVAKAEAMGADPVLVHLARALANAPAPDRQQALRDTEYVLEADPDNIDALCIRAIAQQDGNKQGARKSLDRVKTLGGPTNPIQSFLYGYAIHFVNPDTARTSYLQAIRDRAKQDDEMYPQAMVHFARAQNQLMYRTRQIGDHFDEADRLLHQLTIAGLYDAYPYYLLSITHRLAAEIYAAPPTPRIDKAETHWERAMKWARDGQISYPEDDRPITAEAECYESRGNYAKAIEARTRAIQRAKPSDNELTAWEGYHYRWRLHYWQSQFDEALADLGKLKTYEISEVFYGDVYPAYANAYPALVEAEMGNIDRALTTVRRIADESPHDPMRAIWTATCLRILGQPAEADALLAESEKIVDYTFGDADPDLSTWRRRLYTCCRAQTPIEELLDLAEDLPDPRTRRAEVHFHVAATHLASGRRSEALGHLDSAYRCFDRETRYTYHAKTLLVKLEDAAWPPWVPATTVSRFSVAP